jgi:3-hydroxyacyl-CoA dehydrogenase
MLDSGINKFYRYVGGQKEYYDIKNKKYSKVPGTKGLILLDAFKKSNIVWSNEGTSLYDIGDGILNLEFHTKMNTMGEDVLIGINKAISICKKNFMGLIIGNEADVFSAGANLGELFMMAGNRDFDKIDYGIAAFQNTIMNIRYSSVPVVAATSGLTLGGGCELSLHADKIQAHNETYMGLVELGVGLIPSGCGTKEVVLRVSENYKKGDPELNALMEGFMKIAQGKVSTSAVEAKNLGYIKKSDNLTANRKNLLKDAKNTILNMLTYGYVSPKRKKEIKVHGRTSIAMFNAGIETMKQGSYISDYDQFLAKKLAYVVSGGDLTQETLVSEQYLLDLEREVQVSLLGEPKTLERMHSILFKRKPLRN